jgi:hypothetical protein
MAVRALERANRNYHIVATSVSTAGQLAGVSAGLAVTTTLQGGKLPEDIRLVRPHKGLPDPPRISFLMLKRRDVPAHLVDI